MLYASEFINNFGSLLDLLIFSPEISGYPKCFSFAEENYQNPKYHFIQHIHMIIYWINIFYTIHLYLEYANVIGW